MVVQPHTTAPRTALIPTGPTPPQGGENLEGNVFPHLDDVPFVGQGEIGKRRLAKKGTMDDLIALSQGRGTVRTSAVEIVQEEIQTIEFLADLA